MWPSGTSKTNILLAGGGGEYARPDVNSTSLEFGGDADTWLHPLDTGESSYTGFHDGIFLVYKDSTFDFYNASIAAYHQWEVLCPNGRNYTAPVGILGLGPSGNDPSSLLGQMKADGTIASMFGGLHIGSALLEQPGSMILGGYEQNRVLGDVGTFDLFPTGPRAFLLDVVLGVETGASPFNRSSNISLWHGIEDSTHYAGQSQDAGGRTGSRLINFNPSVPYMYLPLGICETAAQYLPLTWNADLELYTWNIGEEAARIISSPAYVAFVFADNQAKNITIKVPFQVLNLTLLPPIVDIPTQYFPCMPWDEPLNHQEILLFGGYLLGRAFLQAAFLGFEFEHNLSYIAQAPGPTMEQSSVKTYQPNDTSVTPNPLGTFASSWASSWKILDSEHSTDNSTNKTINTLTSDNKTSSQPTSSPSGGGFSGGATAGVVVGSVFGALAIAAAAALLWRKRKTISRQAAINVKNEVTTAPLSDQFTGADGYPTELAHCQEPSEVYGNAPPHEMVEDGMHEAPNQPSHHELPLRRSW